MPELNERWVTIQGRHVFIGKGGEILKGGAGLGDKIIPSGGGGNGEQAAVDKFVAGVQDLNLEKDSDVQKFHDAKMAFLAEQGCSKKDIATLDSAMDDFTANSTLVQSVMLARMGNKLNGLDEMGGIRKSPFIKDKDYNVKIRDGVMKTFELNTMANQAMLRAKFGNEIELSRGICKLQARNVINSAKGGKADVGVGALSSWTGDAKIASRFAISGTGKSSGAVLTSRFKTSNIMDSHYTNPKFRRMNESEFVVFGTRSVKGASLGSHKLAKDASQDADSWAQ